MRYVVMLAAILIFLSGTSLAQRSVGQALAEDPRFESYWDIIEHDIIVETAGVLLANGSLNPIDRVLYLPPRE